MLSIVWYLAAAVHDCTVCDERDLPGGQIRAGGPEEMLPREILAGESCVPERLGVRIRPSTRVGREIGWDELRRGHDAVVRVIVRIGPVEKADARDDDSTFRTNEPDRAVTSARKAVTPEERLSAMVMTRWGIRGTLAMYLRQMEDRLGPARRRSHAAGHARKMVSVS